MLLIKYGIALYVLIGFWGAGVRAILQGGHGFRRLLELWKSFKAFLLQKTSSILLHRSKYIKPPS
jgi:hypothetical protein